MALYGKVESAWKGRGLQINQPQFEILDSGQAELEAGEVEDLESLEVGRIVPIYESAAGAKLTSRWFRRIILRGAAKPETRYWRRIPPAMPRLELMTGVKPLIKSTSRP